MHRLIGSVCHADLIVVLVDVIVLVIILVVVLIVLVGFTRVPLDRVGDYARADRLPATSATKSSHRHRQAHPARIPPKRSAPSKRSAFTDFTESRLSGAPRTNGQRAVGALLNPYTLKLGCTLSSELAPPASPRVKTEPWHALLILLW